MGNTEWMLTKMCNWEYHETKSEVHLNEVEFPSLDLARFLEIGQNLSQKPAEHCNFIPNV